MDASGEPFGDGRLAEVLLAHRHEPARIMVHAVVEATRQFTGRTGFEDDFTVVVVKRDSGEQPARD
jgi:serine phosphatase RsbU (regulator of sigma subunit)